MTHELFSWIMPSAHMMLALWTAVTLLLWLFLAYSKAYSAMRLLAFSVISLMLWTTPSTICNDTRQEMHHTDSISLLLTHSHGGCAAPADLRSGIKLHYVYNQTLNTSSEIRVVCWEHIGPTVHVGQTQPKPKRKSAIFNLLWHFTVYYRVHTLMNSSWEVHPIDLQTFSKVCGNLERRGMKQEVVNNSTEHGPICPKLHTMDKSPTLNTSTC